MKLPCLSLCYNLFEEADCMDIDSEVNKILETLTRAGFEVAIVGGAVRQIIVSKPPTDWDLTTNAKPEQILKLFKNV